MDVDPELHSELRARVEDRIRCEVERDVDGWIAITDPAIVAKRDDDEVERIKREVAYFMDLVSTACVKSVRVTKHLPSVPLRGGRPAALVESEVLYNHDLCPATYRTVWVQDDGVWYSTAILKGPLRKPPPL